MAPAGFETERILNEARFVSLYKEQGHGQGRGPGCDRRDGSGGLDRQADGCDGL